MGLSRSLGFILGLRASAGCRDVGLFWFGGSGAEITVWTVESLGHVDVTALAFPGVGVQGLGFRISGVLLGVAARPLGAIQGVRSGSNPFCRPLQRIQNIRSPKEDTSNVMFSLAVPGQDKLVFKAAMLCCSRMFRAFLN